MAIHFVLPMARRLKLLVRTWQRAQRHRSNSVSNQKLLQRKDSVERHSLILANGRKFSRESQRQPAGIERLAINP